MSLVLSIVTPSLNQGKFIEQTITSVLSQEGNFFIDYIIIDACSSDETIEIIKKYAYLLESGKWEVKCLGIKFQWISEPDKGQADGINKGFRMARGDIFCWLNSDDLYSNDILNIVTKVNWSTTDFIYGKGLWISNSGDELGIYPTFPPNKYTLSFTCTICQPTVFFTKQVFESLGDLSTDYELVFDYEYWLRAVHSGKKFRFHPQVSARSRMYPENKSCSLIVTGDKERVKLLHQYSSDISFVESVIMKMWKIRILQKTITLSEGLMKRVIDGVNN